jgi:hypothetical protein
MKTKRFSILVGILAVAIMQFAVMSSLAQVATNGNTIIINNFDTAYQVTNNNSHAWQNWYGTAYSNVLWSANDASNNPNSGSLEIVAYFPDAGVGGNYGPQFLAIDGFGPFFPPLPGNGAPTNYYATNFSCDVQIAPFSVTNQFGQFPLLEFGTASTNYSSAYDFGTLQLYSTNTNWVHVSIPITASANWVQIPGIFIKSYSTLTGIDVVYVDNLQFQMSISSNAPAPPSLNIQKPTTGLRIFAGSTINTYDREQLTALDQNQSWVGGTYPVSYSYTLKSFPAITSSNQLFRFHIFLVPVNSAPSNSPTNNEYFEYQAGNDLWFNLTANNPTNVLAEVAWKTNLPNANPNNEVVSNYYSTAIGTWTLTFSTATNGTLTPPVGSPAAFTLPNAATIATDFGNPVVAQFGVQPDSGYGEGKYADVTKISTVGVASPGVAIYDDFTSDTALNTTNLWDVSNSANTNSLVLMSTNAAWWVYWSGPAVGYGLGTKADIGRLHITMPITLLTDRLDHSQPRKVPISGP